MTTNADTGDSSGSAQVAGNLANALNSQTVYLADRRRRRRLSDADAAAETESRKETRTNIMAFLNRSSSIASTDSLALKQQAGVIASVVAFPEETSGQSIDSGNVLVAQMVQASLDQGDGFAEGSASSLLSSLGSMMDATALVMNDERHPDGRCKRHQRHEQYNGWCRSISTPMWAGCCLKLHLE